MPDLLGPGTKRWAADEFGGLCTITSVGDTPEGMSPDMRNTEFFPGGVRSRDGFAPYSCDTLIVKRIAQYIQPDGTKTKLWFFTDGTIKKEYPEGTFTVIASGSSSAGSFAQATRPQSITLFGKQFIAFGDGSRGYELPRQWNGTSLLPVAPDGPGKPMTVTAAPAATQGFNFTSTTNINLVVCFVTSTGYVSPPSPVVNIAVATVGTGANDLTCNNVATGPSYVTERWIFASPSDGGTDMYHVPGGGMQIKDNTSTSSAAFGYSDAVLLNSLRLSDTAGQRMSAVAGFCPYGERLVSWGALSSIQPILSARADGATGTDFNTAALVGPINWRFEGGSTAGVPNGWTSVATGSALTTPGDPCVGNAMRWTGDGTAAHTGEIDASGSATIHDGIQSPFLSGRNYAYRIRCRRSSGATGTFRITGTGGNWDLDIDASVGTDWSVLDSGTSTVAKVDPHLLVLSTDPLPNGEWFELDWMEAFEQKSPYQRSAVYVSRAGFPESLDGVITVNPDDGQEVRGCFVLRGNLYIVKERSLYYTRDTGDVPSQWRVDQVSASIGAISPHCAVNGDSNTVIANSNGVYVFDGAQPVKISQEIDDTWRANSNDLDAWIAIDNEYNRIFVKNGSYYYVCNFFDGLESGVHTGGRGRKWTLWEHSGSSANRASTGLMAVRDDDSLSLIIGRQATASNEVYDSVSSFYAGGYPGAAGNPWYHTLGLPAAPPVTGLADPLGGALAFSRTYGGGACDSLVAEDTAVTGARYVFGSIWLRVQSGTLAINVTVQEHGGSPGVAFPYTLTTRWQRCWALASLTNAGEMRLTFTGPVTMEYFGWSIQSGPTTGASLDRGYVVANPGPVSGINNSFAQYLSKDQTWVRDSDSMIASYYVCFPAGEMSGRSKFLLTTLKCWGSGTLKSYLFKVYPYAATALADKTIQATPVEDLEIQSDFSAQIAQLRFGVTGSVSAKWNVSRAAIFYNLDSAPFRLVS